MTRAELRAKADAAKPCTCHPDDNPPVPCAQKYALFECRAAAMEARESEPVAWRPDPRIALLEGLLGEALDTCHLGDDAGLHKRMREALGLAT